MKKYPLEKEHLKERIFTLRKSLGLSQAKFAQKIEKTPGLISLVETGRSSLGDDTLQMICTVFLVDPEWLYTGNGDIFLQEQPKKEVADLGNRIRQVRTELHLSRDRFSKEIDCTTNYVYLMEICEKIPSDKLLQRISSTFNVNYEWLLNGEGEMFRTIDGEVDDHLIRWLREHPAVVKEIKSREDYC